MSRFTVERFLGGIGDAVARDQLVVALQSGYQIKVSTLDYQLVPAVLILACYALHHLDAELVDDYEKLVEVYREAVSEFGMMAHPDLFMASCISLLHKRQEYPSLDTFYTINVPELFEQMVFAYEEE